MMFETIKIWFNRSVNNYNKPLTKYSFHIVKSLPPAQDIVQESFLRLWNHGKIKEDRSLKVWLFKTTRNLSIDFLRKEKRKSYLNPDQENTLECPKNLPSEQLEAKQ